MRIFFLIFIVLGFIPSIGFSQTGNLLGAAGQENLKALEQAGTGNVLTFDNRYQGIKGNPYFLNTYLPGSIVVNVGNLGNTKVINGLKLKYDVYEKGLIAFAPGSADTVRVGISSVSSFNIKSPISNDTIQFRRLKEAQSLGPNYYDTFFAVLYQGKTTLAKTVNKKMVPASFKGAYSSGQNFDELVEEIQYFVINKGQIQQIKLNKKSILGLLADKSDSIKYFLSKENLKMNSEADILKVLVFYDTL